MNKVVDKNSTKYFLGTILGALGVVYGDIGTSPLYALRECFNPNHGLILNHDNVVGVLSLLIWSLIFVVTLKYLALVLKADNHGEGGVLALMSLALQSKKPLSDKKKYLIVGTGLFGAALLYGDGAITPAISVLSAVEGLKVASPFFEQYVTTITIAILCFLFFMQKRGSGKLGVLFGPIVLVWFTVLGLLGIRGITSDPHILTAFNPYHAFSFLIRENSRAFLTLGSVFLVLTGAEALYADMGHFGKRSIRYGWTFVVFPGLILNYLGQGALILNEPSAAESPFYLLAPEWALYPLVILATITTVIASQALITGAYSITSQAIQLGYLPRLQILHTSLHEKGQIYLPLINWVLFCATVVLVLSFHSSTNLASAYGIAVATTMMITTLLVYIVAADVWQWKKPIVLFIVGVFGVIDLAFFGANIIKFQDGGWVPLALGAGIFLIMTTWWKGRVLLWNRLRFQVSSFKDFFAGLNPNDYTRIPGTAVFMIRDLQVTPPALTYNLRHNKVLHEKVILLTVVTDEQPVYGENKERVEILELGAGFYRLIIHYGFMENPNVPAALKRWCTEEMHFNLEDTIFFMDRVIPIPTDYPGMAMWRERIFAFMSQNALKATAFYQIPVTQVIEIGYQVEI